MNPQDPRPPNGRPPDRRNPRPPARGKHPSLSPSNASWVQGATPNDFLGLDVELQRARAEAQAAPQPEEQPMHLFMPPTANPDPRVSTNTTLIPRSTLFAPMPQHPAMQAYPQQQQQHVQQHAPRMQPAQQQPHAHHAPQAQQPHAPQPYAHPHPQQHAQPAPRTQPQPAPQRPYQPPPPGFLDPRLGGTGGYGTPPPAPPARTNSWLLGLDDARSGRAGVGPVVHDPSRRSPALVAPAQLDASFAEAPPVSSRTVPWLVRGLIGAAAASFLFVVGHTVLSPQSSETKTEYVPPRTTSRIHRESRPELADPGPRGANSAPEAAQPLGRRTTLARPVAPSPARPSLPPAAVNTPPVEDEPPVFQEVQPPEFAPIMKPTDAPPVAPQADGTPDAQQAGVFDAALPAWDPAMVSAPPLARNEAGPAPDELAASPARQARVQSFLMSQSRGAAPLEDLNAEYTPPVNLAGFGAGAPRRTHATTQPAAAPARASGVWDGAVVPVDQIGAKLRVLTPKVGLVRATLSSGDVREGRLHAVGEGHIWIEQTGGTEAIARTRVERLEQIGGPDQATAGDKAAAGTPALTAEKRVRVRTPGGLFYGTIVARDGDTITLLTDDGARVTIEGGSVERAPERKTVVKKEATPKPPKPKPDPVPDAHRDPALEDAAQAAHGSTPGG